MTETKRKRVITIETWQRTVIRQSLSETLWCEFCGAQVEMFTPEQAAIIFDLDFHKINQGIENGSLHFMKVENGSLFLCLNSLKKKLNRRNYGD
jgi:hypothetical protein